MGWWWAWCSGLGAGAKVITRQPPLQVLALFWGWAAAAPAGRTSGLCGLLPPRCRPVVFQCPEVAVGGQRGRAPGTGAL